MKIPTCIAMNAAKKSDQRTETTNPFSNAYFQSIPDRFSALPACSYMGRPFHVVHDRHWYDIILVISSRRHMGAKDKGKGDAKTWGDSQHQKGYGKSKAGPATGV
jgi:hypothetical protein